MEKFKNLLEKSKALIDYKDTFWVNHKDLLPEIGAEVNADVEYCKIWEDLENAIKECEKDTQTPTPFKKPSGE